MPVSVPFPGVANKDISSAVPSYNTIVPDPLLGAVARTKWGQVRVAGEVYQAMNEIPDDMLHPLAPRATAASAHAYVDAAHAGGMSGAASGFKGGIPLTADLGGIRSMPLVPAVRLARW
jgi:hypothetical protein